MIVCMDVGYHGDTARAAAVCIENWTDPKPLQEKILELPVPAPYQPGSFYLRELPCLLALIAALSDVKINIHTIVIDGYVWLDEQQTPALGAHLYEALAQRVPIVGVAKTPFRESPHAIPVLRGQSIKPLYVTAAGIDRTLAAANVRAMHGLHRIPEILRYVDSLT